MDFDRLRFVSERADSSETLLSVRLPERPGAFRQLYESVYPRNVTELSYRITAMAASEGLPWADGKEGSYTGATAPKEAHVYLSYQSKSDEDKVVVDTKLTGYGFDVTNLTDNEMAKAHARYLAGGRAPGVQCERLYRFEFPERSGALGTFLNQMSVHRQSAPHVIPRATPGMFS